jgi:hypothetical protein
MFDPAHSAVAGISPRSGEASGGARVVLFGFHIATARSIRFGQTSSSDFFVPTKYGRANLDVIGVRVPPGVAGTKVPITVVTANGRIERFAGSGFLYRAR